MGLFRKRSKPWQPSGNHRRGNHRFRGYRRGYRFVVTSQSSNNQPALTGTKRGNSLETAAVETTSNRGNHPGNLAVETIGFPANQSANLCGASLLFWGGYLPPQRPLSVRTVLRTSAARTPVLLLQRLLQRLLPAPQITK
jgi:hypothetical protein